jgi:serine/threonine-protein kinase
MLAGEPPHTGPTAQAILARQQSEAPRSIRVLRPAVPEEVERIVLTALAKPPADRFTTVSEFAAALAGSAVQGHPGERRSWAQGRSVVLGILLSVALGGLVWLARQGPGRAPAAPDGLEADPTHVAVLYFDDLSERGTLRPVADGLSEDLIDVLGQVSALHVISPNGVRPYLGRQASPDSIGRALGVGTLVGGSVERSGERLRVTVRLIDARSGQQLQSRTLEYPFGALFALQDELTLEVSRFLRERLGREVLLRELRKGTRSVAAWQLAQEGEVSREAARTLQAQGDVSAAKRALDAAESLFTRAGDTDPAWPDPLVLRGWVAADRMRLSERNPPDSLRVWFAEGVKHADGALRVRSPFPPALELRGTLRYRYWLATGSETAEVKRAEEDLRAGAVLANPTQARAWGTLSALLQATGQLAEANLLASRAYEADAFLAESPQLLFRLYYTSLDLGKEQEAVRWCNTGANRFPQDWHFTFCQLTILAWPGPARKAGEAKADVARAWALVSQLERLSPPEDRVAFLPRWQIRVAGVLGRAGLADSAEAVIGRARAAAPDDPEMDFYEAEARMLLGDREAALRLLTRDLEANPRFREYMRVYPVFRPLWTDPRFQGLMEEPPKNTPQP